MNKESSVFESMDDNKQKVNHLWTNKDIHSISKIPTVYESIAAKLSVSNKNLEIRTFFIKKNFFCYRKKNSKMRAYMDLEWAKIRFKELKNPKAPAFNGFDYEIKIIKNGKFSLVYVETEQELSNWRSAFTRINLILTDFHNIYKPLKTVGEGGFSKVYEVKKKIGNQTYAAKAIKKKRLLKNTKNIRRLKNEITMLRTLKNTPNTLDLFEVHETEGSIYLISPYLEGGEIFENYWLSQTADLKKARVIIFCILKAVWNIQKAGIIHRDLKPGNIMIENSWKIMKIEKLISNENIQKDIEMDETLNEYERSLLNYYEENLKIIDFGNSVSRKSKHVNPYSGTPGFLAPELFYEHEKEFFHEKVLSSKIDVYSVGVLFFYLQFGEFPFGEERVEDILEKNKRNLFSRFKLEHQVFKQKNPPAFDLLMCMMKTDFNRRFSVEECIKHEFFKKMPKDFLNDSIHGSYKKLMKDGFGRTFTEIIETVND